MCQNCHEQFHKIYGKNNNTIEQFNEFSNNKNLNLDIRTDLSTLKKVVLLNENKIYNTIKECANDLNINSKRIYDVCNHKAYSVNEYHFMYLDEYNSIPKNELKKAFTFQGHNDYGKGVEKSVVCVNTGEEFKSISDACEKYLGNRKNDGRIAKCCDGLKDYVEKLPNGEKLKWKWKR